MYNIQILNTTWSYNDKDTLDTVVVNNNPSLSSVWNRIQNSNVDKKPSFITLLYLLNN